jgi:hypothetical protein
MIRVIIGSLLTGSLLLAVAPEKARATEAEPATQSAPDEEVAAVIKAVRAFIAADSIRDEKAMRDLVHPGGMTTGALCGAVPDNVQKPMVDYIAESAEQPDTQSETLSDPEVRIDANLATVWGRYVYRTSDQEDPTEGYSSYQLIRTEEGWKILNYSWSVWSDECTR